MPPEAYAAPLVRARFAGAQRLYLVDPALIQDALVRHADDLAKTDDIRRVLGPALGRGPADRRGRALALAAAGRRAGLRAGAARRLPARHARRRRGRGPPLGGAGRGRRGRRRPRDHGDDPRHHRGHDAAGGRRARRRPRRSTACPTTSRRPAGCSPRHARPAALDAPSRPAPGAGGGGAPSRTPSGARWRGAGRAGGGRRARRARATC